MWPNVCGQPCPTFRQSPLSSQASLSGLFWCFLSFKKHMYMLKSSLKYNVHQVTLTSIKPLLLLFYCPYLSSLKK